jgi:hypothetical protein
MYSIVYTVRVYMLYVLSCIHLPLSPLDHTSHMSQPLSKTAEVKVWETEISEEAKRDQEVGPLFNLNSVPKVGVGVAEMHKRRLFTTPWCQIWSFHLEHTLTVFFF